MFYPPKASSLNIPYPIFKSALIILKRDVVILPLQRNIELSVSCTVYDFYYIRARTNNITDYSNVTSQSQVAKCN